MYLHNSEEMTLLLPSASASVMCGMLYYIILCITSTHLLIFMQILIQSVCETMVPKLVAEDIPLLFSLLSDVFPNVGYTRAEMAGMCLICVVITPVSMWVTGCSICLLCWLANNHSDLVCSGLKILW
jgi:hypothetical protein